MRNQLFQQRLLTLLILAFCLVSMGCWEFPLTITPTSKIDDRLLGNWIDEEGNNMIYRVEKKDEWNYLLSSDSLSLDNQTIYHSDIDGARFISIFYDGNSKKKTANGFFSYFSFQFEENGNVLRMRYVNDDIVKRSRNHTEVLKSLKNNLRNPKLYRGEFVLKRIQSTVEPSQSTTPKPTASSTVLAGTWFGDGSNKKGFDNKDDVLRIREDGTFRHSLQGKTLTGKIQSSTNSDFILSYDDGTRAKLILKSGLLTVFFTKTNGLEYYFVRENSNTSVSPLPTQPKATSSLEGTKWSYTFGAGDVLMVADTVLSFEKNGKVISEKSETADIFDLFGSTTKVEGTYRQEGDKIFINLPKATINGVIRGDSLELISTFKEDNRTLKWTAKKVTP